MSDGTRIALLVIGRVSEEARQGDTMKKIVLPLLILFSMAIGCIESNPQPSPAGDSGGQANIDEPDDAVAPKASPTVDEGLMYASAPGEDEGIIVVGAASAAIDASEGRANGDEDPPEDPDGDDDGDFGVNEDGSFVVVIPKPVPPKVTLVFTFPDGGEVMAELYVPGSDQDDERSPWLYSGESQEEPANGPPADYDGFKAGAGVSYGITAADLEDGTVEVVGGFLSVTPLAKVVLANVATGDTVVEQVTNTGEFVAQIGGMAGDAISMFAVNPDEKEQATSPVMLVVE